MGRQRLSTQEYEGSQSVVSGTVSPGGVHGVAVTAPPNPESSQSVISFPRRVSMTTQLPKEQPLPLGSQVCEQRPTGLPGMSNVHLPLRQSESTLQYSRHTCSSNVHSCSAAQLVESRQVDPARPVPAGPHELSLASHRSPAPHPALVTGSQPVSQTPAAVHRSPLAQAPQLPEQPSPPHTRVPQEGVQTPQVGGSAHSVHTPSRHTSADAQSESATHPQPSSTSPLRLSSMPLPQISTGGGGDGAVTQEPLSQPDPAGHSASATQAIRDGGTAQVPAAQTSIGAQSASLAQEPEAEDQHPISRHAPVPGQSASAEHGSRHIPARHRAIPAHVPSAAQSGAE